MAADPFELKKLPTEVTCAGPPACPFEREEAFANMRAGCPLCTRVAVHPDGSLTTFRLPAH